MRFRGTRALKRYAGIAGSDFVIRQEIAPTDVYTSKSDISSIARKNVKILPMIELD